MVSFPLFTYHKRFKLGKLSGFIKKNKKNLLIIINLLINNDLNNFKKINKWNIRELNKKIPEKWILTYGAQCRFRKSKCSP